MSNVTEYVANDIKTHLQRTGSVPAKLTLIALADYYNVSLTPVRLALIELAEEGYLTKLPNGRLIVNVAKLRNTDTQLTDIATPISPRCWEQELAHDIIRKSLRGEEDYLREELMAQKYEVGRAALRQVFARFANRGLLVHVPRCGWRARSFNEQEMGAYLDVREALEVAALDLARPHLDPQDLRAMLEGNAPSTNDLDNRLHKYLIEKAGNTYIREFFERNGVYYSLLFDFAAPEAAVVKEMAKQHIEILDHLLGKRWGAARQALAKHIQAQRPVVASLMKRIQSESDA